MGRYQSNGEIRESEFLEFMLYAINKPRPLRTLVRDGVTKAVLWLGLFILHHFSSAPGAQVKRRRTHKARISITYGLCKTLEDISLMEKFAKANFVKICFMLVPSL